MPDKKERKRGKKNVKDWKRNKHNKKEKKESVRKKDCLLKEKKEGRKGWRVDRFVQWQMTRAKGV